MEPIFFKPIYKNVIWGGKRIAEVFNRKCADDDIGEAWELSAHKNGLSIISNGEFKDESLLDLFNDKEKRLAIFGKHCSNLERFPILIKFIDANKNLSIQVHPDDNYARKYENDSGKSEVWYVMDCNDGAKLVYGFKDDVIEENLREAINNIEENVNYVDIHKGDFISIPSGTVHAIMEGTLICEIQQSSDITYRVYDWNRVDKNGKPRELHREKALDVIRLEKKNAIDNYANLKEDTNLYASNIFKVDMIKVKQQKNLVSNKESFTTYIVVERKWKNNI